MVTDIAKAGISPARNSLLAARDALTALATPRKKTEAEQKLDEILTNLKSSKSNAAKEAVRRKMEQLKAKLEALKLAAGSAAASGDPKLARKVAKDIRDAARELSRALAAAGESAGSGVAAISVPATLPKGDAAAATGAVTADVATTSVGPAAAAETSDPAAKVASDQVKAATRQVKPSNDDGLAALKNEAAGLVKELQKIMRKLRETSMHKLDPKDRAEMEKMFREADAEISGLLATSAPTPGMTVDVCT